MQTHERSLYCWMLIAISCSIGGGISQSPDPPTSSDRQISDADLAAINRFEDIVKPFMPEHREQPLRYGAGTIDRRGRATADMLDCSTFASPILHRLFNDDFSAFDSTIQQGWGDEIAKAYRLGDPVLDDTVEVFLRDMHSSTLPWGVLFFNILNAKGVDKQSYDEGGRGHVGFLIVRPDTNGAKRVTQIHMSGIASVSGHPDGGLVYDDNFQKFIKVSLYGRTEDRRLTSRIMLYKVRLPQPR